MKIFSVNSISERKRADEATLYPFFSPDNIPSPKIQCGFIVFPAGSRVPQEGYTLHAGHEFSYVVAGELEVHTTEETNTIKPGDCSFIPAKQHHYSCNNNHEDCILQYMIVETD